MISENLPFVTCNDVAFPGEHLKSSTRTEMARLIQMNLES